MRGYFIFNGHDSRDYGVYISGMKTYDAPVRDFDQVKVPGRDGVLLYDNGRFDVIEHPYDAFIVREMKQNLQDLRNILLQVIGFVELEDSYHTDEFYLARYMSGLESEISDLHDTARFTLRFTRMPQRFLKSGKEVTILTASGRITNHTLFKAKPLIRVYGAGTLGVGSDTIRITSATEYTDIDCESQNAYYGTTNCNGNVILSGDEFPVLNPGSNGISLGTGITKVEITPRWYRL